MGLSNAPATFLRLMNHILFDYIADGFVIVFMDDILIHSTTAREHLKHVVLIILRLAKFGNKVKLKKCEVAKIKVHFLGHVIGHGTIEPDPEKVSALYQFDLPINLLQLLSFLGLASFYRKFIPQFAEIAKPLYDLTVTKELDKQFKKKNGKVDNKRVILQWNAESERAFNTLRTILSGDKVLMLPDFEKIFYLSTDACNYAYGAVLAQQSIDGLRPVAYFSRGMSNAE